jgi:hypothetical protein
MERLETCLNRESPTLLKSAKLFQETKWSPFFLSKDTEESAFEEGNNLGVYPTNSTILVEGNPVLNRLSPRQKPGLYMIRCDINDKRYYGESTNVSQRLNSHRSLLKQKIHNCRPLQEDWNLYGEKNFDFVPLYMGQSWNQRKNRLEKESSLIHADQKLCYNKYTSYSRSGEDNGFFGKKHSEQTKESIGGPLSVGCANTSNRGPLPPIKRGVPKDKLGKKILLDGQTYPSIAEASRQTTHARKTIRDWLKDANNPRCTETNSDSGNHSGNAQRPSQKE